MRKKFPSEPRHLLEMGDKICEGVRHTQEMLANAIDEINFHLHVNIREGDSPRFAYENIFEAL
jgi:hypothetical protein